MTTYQPAAPIRSRSRRAGIIAIAATAITTVVTSTPASASTPIDRVPAAGSVVTCQATGALTATGGSFLQREPVTVDGRGRAHVLFTILADRVVLRGTDGTRYRLVGGGYDYVIYPSKAVVGDVVEEREQFVFNVTGPRGVVGVVRFFMHTAADQIPHIRDTSTCQLPNMS